jgi:hypothetical protein
VKEAERLTEKCPQCHALPGEPCHDFAGNPTARAHRVRGPGQHERKLRDDESRRVARQKAAYGPLFQDIAEQEVGTRSLPEIYWAKRYEVARGAEMASLVSKPNCGLEWVRLWWIAHRLPILVGSEMGTAIWDYALRVFGRSTPYINSYIAECLTTADRKVLRHEVRYDPARVNKYNPDGRYLVDALVWHPAEPVMTRDEYRAMFPQFDHVAGVRTDDEPDDGGLFDRMMQRLAA